ncbi:MAG TPA: RnfABCDGE type electron transport complex subunit D [bacterium]|nr:RnfABCDGE type electron transport complex subunit D [bacterium]
MPYTQGLAPHIRSSESVPKIFWLFSASLLPALGVSLYFHLGSNLLLIFVCVTASLLAEIAARNLFGRKTALRDGTAFFTGLLFALMLPGPVNAEKAGLAVFLGLFLGRELFGGLGANLFHPALLAAALMEIFSPGFTIEAGSADRALVIAIALGALLLIGKKTVYWEVPVIYLFAFFALSYFFEKGMPSRFLTPAVFFTAFYFVTDPPTSPLTRSGSRLYALASAGLGAAFSRGPLAGKGPYFAVLFMNALSPWIDAWIRPRTLAKTGSVAS